MLKTKSIQQPRKNTDGIRVCIMRRIKPEFDFDMWIIPLAPSTELLKKYHGNEIGWKQYEELYSKEVLNIQEVYLKILGNIASNNTLTLLCWEDEPSMCHRRLVAEKIQSLFPKLAVSFN